MKEKNAYIIIGNKNTRKSSVIRCLTGCYNRGTVEIKLKNDKIIDMYVLISSLQESKISLEDYIKMANEQDCKNVLFGLREKSMHNLPDGIDYIDGLEKAGWNIKKIATLANTNSTIYPNAEQFENSAKEPANATSNLVRKYFEWI